MNLSRLNCFDVADMSRTLTDVRIKINNIQHLEIGDKIGFNDEGVLIIHKASFTQPFVRWFSGECRGTALETLRKYMDDLNLFLKMMLISRVSLMTNQHYIMLWSQCVALLKQLCRGIEALLITYRTDSVYCDQLEPYKETFNMFLAKFEKLEKDFVDIRETYSPGLSHESLPPMPPSPMTTLSRNSPARNLRI